MSLSRARITAAAVALAGILIGYSQSKPVPRFQVVETTIDDIHMAMGSGRLSSHDLVQAYLDRIKAFDKQGPALNCIITLNPGALQEADRLDAVFKRSGMVCPLHGIPVLVKDEIDTAGKAPKLGAAGVQRKRPRRH